MKLWLVTLQLCESILSQNGPSPWECDLVSDTLFLRLKFSEFIVTLLNCTMYMYSTLTDLFRNYWTQLLTVTGLFRCMTFRTWVQCFRTLRTCPKKYTGNSDQHFWFLLYTLCKAVQTMNGKPLIPTDGAPDATAARAYSIWTSLPDGLKNNTISLWSPALKSLQILLTMHC